MLIPVVKRADSDNAATFQAPFRLEKYTKYGTAFADVSRRAHSASAPLFIPDFTGVRRQIVEHLNDSIHDLEAKLSTASDKETRNEYILEAVKLLECMGMLRSTDAGRREPTVRGKY